MAHLRAHGLVPRSPQVTRPTPETLIEFQEWLRRHRGLAASTVTRYLMLVAKMLPSLGEGRGGVTLARSTSREWSTWRSMSAGLVE